MTRDEALYYLKHIKTPLVKSHGKESNQHFNVCTMLRVEGDCAIIIPPGHKQWEKCPLDRVWIWKSKLPPSVPIYTPHPAIVRTPLSKPLVEPIIAQKLEQALKETIVPEPVKTKIKRAHIQHTDEKWNEARRLRAMSKNWKDIAYITGIKYATLYNKLSKETPMVNVQAPTIPLALAVIEPRQPEPKAPSKPAISDAVAGLYATLRQILRLPIPDTSKLLAIEGLLSHE